MKYFGKPINNLPKYESPNFVPLVRAGHWTTCGSASLGLITGLRPDSIEKCKPKSNKHWSNRAITNFLNKRNYKTFEISVEGVTNCDWEDFPLNNKHVLLINSIIDKNEASWFIAHNNQIWHNQYISSQGFSNLFFLNKPTQNVFLVWHPKWS